MSKVVVLGDREVKLGIGDIEEAREVCKESEEFAVAGGLRIIRDALEAAQEGVVLTLEEAKELRALLRSYKYVQDDGMAQAELRAKWEARFAAAQERGPPMHSACELLLAALAVVVVTWWVGLASLVYEAICRTRGNV